MFLHGIVFSNLGFKVQNQTFNFQRFNRHGIVQKKKAFLQRSSLPYTLNRCLSLFCQRVYHNMVQQFTRRAPVLMFGSQKKHTAWLEVCKNGGRFSNFFKVASRKCEFATNLDGSNSIVLSLDLGLHKENIRNF